jgi:hypothetical protein
MKVSIFCAVLALVSVSPFTLATKINVDSQQGQVEQATIVKDEFDDGSKIEILLLDESTVNKFVYLGSYLPTQKQNLLRNATPFC